jgi:hypothetical protein
MKENGEDMNFSWVNKDNIHNLYKIVRHLKIIKITILVKTGMKKLMYEALDSRKNTVEKRRSFIWKITEKLLV